MRRRLDSGLLALICVAVALAALLGLAMTRPIAVHPIADAAGGADLAVDLTASALPRPGPLTGYPETLARPLIEPGRRPVTAKPPEPARPREAAPPSPPAVAAAALPPLDGLRLLGVVKTGREPYRALVRGAEGQAGQWVVEGDQVGPWRVVGIAEGRVLLEAQGQRVELAMFAAPRLVQRR